MPTPKANELDLAPNGALTLPSDFSLPSDSTTGCRGVGVTAWPDWGPDFEVFGALRLPTAMPMQTIALASL